MRNAKSIQKKSRSHEVASIGGNTYEVKSGSSGNVYTVTLEAQGATCTCDWASYRPSRDNRSGCSHVVSVYNHLTEQADRKVFTWSSEDDARRQHRPIINIGDGLTLTVRKAS